MKVLDKLRTPGHMTYRRVLQETVEPEAFERLMPSFHQSRLQSGGDYIWTVKSNQPRTDMVSTELNDYLDWPFVAQVFRLEREVWHEKYQGRTRQVVFGLTSLTPQKASPKKLLALTRQYWGIENGLHYRRDVTFHEDASESRGLNHACPS